MLPTQCYAVKIENKTLCVHIVQFPNLAAFHCSVWGMLGDCYRALLQFTASYCWLANVAKNDAKPQVHLVPGINT